jgi:hypothetical protein
MNVRWAVTTCHVTINVLLRCVEGTAVPRRLPNCVPSHRWDHRKSPLTACITHPSYTLKAKTWIADCLEITPIQSFPFDNCYWCKNWVLHLLVLWHFSSITLWCDFWTPPATVARETPQYHMFPLIPLKTCKRHFLNFYFRLKQAAITFLSFN